MESPGKLDKQDISPELIEVLKRMRRWLEPLLHMPAGIPGEIISGPPLKAKCQIAWFNNISGITSQLTHYIPDELKTEEFRRRVSEADQLTYDLQMRVTDPETERRLTTLEDIRKGEELIQYFLEKIDRLLLPVRLRQYRDRMQSLLDDFIDEIPETFVATGGVKYKCQWNWFQGLVADTQGFDCDLPKELKSEEFKRKTNEVLRLIRSLHDREPDPDPKFCGQARTLPEDIEKANELLRFFIGEIDRLLAKTP
ncbi:hypothetical protein JW752_03920 [Candidatus Peregrinibacteria bacterium]|nr:hypothetical protein [Candidatus Peregrinibacteria bacterium]